MKKGKKAIKSAKDSEGLNKAMKYGTGNAIAAEKAASKIVSEHPKKAVAAALATGYAASGDDDDDKKKKKKKKKRPYLED
jgi:hypothetical protein